jgi:hypothetical protein
LTVLRDYHEVIDEFSQSEDEALLVLPGISTTE